MASRTFYCVWWIFLAVLLSAAWLPRSPALAGEPPASNTETGLAGAWVRAAEVEQTLGYTDTKGTPSILDIVLDRRTGERWDAETEKELRGELQTQKHQLLATWQLPEKDRPAAELLVTWRDGRMYLCPVVPNADFLAHRFSLIPGATRKRDFLFVEWSEAGNREGVVSPYQRQAK